MLCLAKYRGKLLPLQLLPLFCLILLVPLFPLFSQTSNAKIIKTELTLMGTSIEITLSIDDQPGIAQNAFTAIEKEFKRIEDVMSEWKEESVISKVNANAGSGPVEVTDELFMLVAVAAEVAILTDGAFDPSWAALRGLWSFKPGAERIPTAKELKRALPLIDYRKIVLDQQAHSIELKESNMAIGLGGIAKGYAVDRAAKILKDMGIDNSIIRAGGDMRVQGERGNAKSWRVKIKHPRKEGSLATLPLTDISISTSGDYERFFIKEGRLYHHIIDPKTGYPANKCQSVTVLAPDTMTSDALSTAVFVLGPKTGLELVNSLKGVEVIIVDSAGTVVTSRGIKLQQ